jgi:hypothetical protein
MVMVFASVSTTLPWQNGHLVGRMTGSFNRDSVIVAVSPGRASRHARQWMRQRRQAPSCCEPCRRRSPSTKHFPNGLRRGRMRCAPEPPHEDGWRQGDHRQKGPPREGRGAGHVPESAHGQNPGPRQRCFHRIGSHVLSVRTRVGNRCSRLHIIRRERVARPSRRGHRVGRANQGVDRCSLSRGRRKCRPRRSTG